MRRWESRGKGRDDLRGVFSQERVGGRQTGIYLAADLGSHNKFRSSYGSPSRRCAKNWTKSSQKLGAPLAFVCVLRSFFLSALTERYYFSLYFKVFLILLLL